MLQHDSAGGALTSTGSAELSWQTSEAWFVPAERHCAAKPSVSQLPADQTQPRTRREAKARAQALAQQSSPLTPAEGIQFTGAVPPAQLQPPMAFETGPIDLASLKALPRPTAQESWTNASPVRQPAAPTVREAGTTVLPAAPAATHWVSEPSREASESPAQPRTRRRPVQERPVAQGPVITPGQVGIASVLGLISIAAPLGNGSAVAAPHKSTAHSAQLSAAAVPSTASQALPGVLAGAQQQSAANKAAQAAQPGGASSSRSERAVLPGCDGKVASNWDSYSNGKIPKDLMCTLWDGRHRLRPDAAVALAKLNVAYEEEFGEELSITDSYRSYEAQVDLKRRKPRLAGKPGTSNHGWGRAIDVANVDFRDREYTWLRENAPKYGWDNPSWARSNGSKPEPWHWQYKTNK